MYKKKIKFTDYLGNEREQEYMFSINKAEALTLRLSENGSIENRLRRLINTSQVTEIVEIIRSFILSSYGEISDDGLRFIKKSPVDGHKLSEDFEQTEAFSELFTDLITDPDKALEFIKRVLPTEMQQKIAEAEASGKLKSIKNIDDIDNIIES